MKKFVFATTMLLLSSIALQASSTDLSPKATALNQEIEALQKELQEKVEAFNTQLEQDAANHPPAAPEITTKADTTKSSALSEENDLKKRLEALEREVKILKETAKPLDGARTPEEAAATKKANETAPLLPTNTPAVAQYNQALTLLKNNELEKAVVAFGQILKDYPNDPYAHKAQVHLGDVFKQLGQLDDAERAYSLALTYDLEPPLMVECRLGLGETLAALKKLKPACDQLKIVQKESIDDNQKKRLQEALAKGSCSK